MNHDDLDITVPVTVLRPTSGRKVEALKAAINRQRLVLDSTPASSVSRGRIEDDLEALEAILNDYQPENRRRAIIA